MKVICLYTDTPDLTPGDTYTVLGNPGSRLVLENDTTAVRGYPADWFEEVV